MIRMASFRYFEYAITTVILLPPAEFHLQISPCGSSTILISFSGFSGAFAAGCRLLVLQIASIPILSGITIPGHFVMRISAAPPSLIRGKQQKASSINFSSLLILSSAQAFQPIFLNKQLMSSDLLTEFHASSFIATTSERTYAA